MEIGSEFWLEGITKKTYNIENSWDKIFFMSGRTAIDYALNIIEKKGKINIVYFPSYCCQSMLIPFINRNIKIEFYTVDFKNGNIIYNIDCNKNCDIFFAMNYFGFSSYNMDYYIENFKNRNIYVIEDSTHSWLSKRKYSEKSDFIVASLRKWFPIISGGILINQSIKDFNNVDIRLENNQKYIETKKNAMIKKFNYINSNKKEKANKEEFLKEFLKSNKILENDYKNYKIDEISYSFLKNINLDDIIYKRNENTKKIYQYLKNQKEIQYLKEVNFEKDCPIFVPIFLEKDKRDYLKKYLMENEVYCPNHWPIPEKINKEQQKIYNMELSLICDQRYGQEDIQRYIQLINKI